LPGWGELSDDMTEKGYKSLPENLRNYVKFIEDQVSCHVSIISISPERSQTIIR
jgi:adenylosuccinate synthase